MPGFEWKSEGDLRKAVREGHKASSRWIEPAAGSTIGLADTVIPREDRQVQWVELKSGELKVVDGKEFLHFKVRPAQRENAQWAHLHEQALCFLVAEKGGRRVWAFLPEPDVLAGKVELGGYRQWCCEGGKGVEGQIREVLLQVWRFQQFVAGEISEGSI